MEHKEVLEGNKIIAQFMELIITNITDDGRIYFLFLGGMTPISLEGLLYNSSWDWLMPVYKRVSEDLKKLEFKLTSESIDSRLHQRLMLLKRIGHVDVVIQKEILQVNIERTFERITEAIKFLNEQNEK